jgi:hypothetical protein
MVRKKKTTEQVIEAPSPTAHWVISHETTIHGRKLVKGTEISIKGERGRFNFVRHVYNPKIDSEWLDVVGGPVGYKTMRSFSLDKVRRVHNKVKTKEGRRAKGLDVE